jgi:hypothetical protein
MPARPLTAREILHRRRMLAVFSSSYAPARAREFGSQ